MKPEDPPVADAAVVESLLAKVPWPEGDAGLDDETLAAWVEGALSEAEQAAVESRLAEWPQGRAWMAEVKASREAWDPPTPREAEPPSTLRQTAWMPLAAAALLLVAFGIAHFLGGFAAGEPSLAEVVAQLKTDDADLFGEFELLDATYLAGRREVERGGLVAGFPHHTELYERPMFRWEQRDGIEEFTVSLYDREGRTLWSRTAKGNALAYPSDEKPLEPGASYVWEVSGDSGLGVQTSRRRFDVASAADRERMQAAQRATKHLGDRQGLVLAHLAIQMDLLEHAQTLLRTMPRDPADAELLRQTQGYVSGQ